MTFQDLDLAGTYSYADYLKWTFDERIELIKGKIFSMSAPARQHQRISGKIFNRIYNFLGEDSPCHVYEAPFDVRLTPLKSNTKEDKIHTVVQPDICVICDLAKLDDRGCIGSPDLIIEILSPGNSRKEMKEKYEIYEENGVKEYWLVEPAEKAIFVYVLNEKGKYIGLQPASQGDMIKSSVMQGFEASVTAIFKD